MCVQCRRLRTPRGYSAGNKPAAGGVFSRRPMRHREGRLTSSELARFETAVLPHLDAAYTLARYLTGNEHDAEDVVQDACLRALKYFDGFRGEGGTSARAWLLTIVRNTAYTWRRRHRADALDHGVRRDCSTVTPWPMTTRRSRCSQERREGNTRSRARPPGAGIPRGDRPARAPRTVVQGDQRGRGRAGRHGHVAPVPRPRAAPGGVARRGRELTVTHPGFEAQLDAYLDGELAAVDARELEAHLTQCPECARFRDGRLALRAAITARVPAFQAPDCPAPARAGGAQDGGAGARARTASASGACGCPLALAASSRDRRAR